MNSRVFEEKFSEKIPDVPGVYFFIGDRGEILYIGKATSLRDRIRSYFSQDILLARGPKISRMLDIAERIKWQKTDSALEALLLEAELIRRENPPYNTDAKDDKSWNTVVITKEKFPRILIERGRTIEQRDRGMQESGEGKNVQKYVIRSFFGPFPSGGMLKEALKIVRKIFPFRDSCKPPSERKETEKDIRPCFNAQIGLCPGVCVGAVSAVEYRKTIRNIELFFSGKKSVIVKRLEKEMRSAAKDLRFERASEIKKTIFSLAHIRDVAILSRDFLNREGGTGHAERIEGFDVAHLQGKETVGVMTVIEGGQAEKAKYRTFIIRRETNGNDFAALEELLRRRFGHEEWEYPSLIVVDGSHLQRRVAERVLLEFALKIPIVSVVKDEHHHPKGILGPKAEKDRSRENILLANAEAHRFAVSFHRKRRGKSFLA